MASMVARLVLASGSPRRRELLESAGFEFEAIAPDVDEDSLPGESAASMARRLSEAKALAVAPDVDVSAFVLGCDTTIALDGEVIGKPRDEDDALHTLMRMAGRTHDVISGFCVVIGGEVRHSGEANSTVTMRPYGHDEALDYVRTGEPKDRAGSYAIQGLGRRLVAAYTGSFTNIMGLPLDAVVPVLDRLMATPVVDDA
jgi:septum formation protein